MLDKFTICEFFRTDRLMCPTRPRKKRMVTKSLFEYDYDLSGLLSQFLLTKEKTGPGEGILFDIYSAIVESASDSMYIVDGYCRFLVMNRVHLTRLCLTLVEVVDSTYGEFQTEEQTKDFENVINEVLAYGRSVKQEHRSGRDDRYFLRTFNPLKNPSGENTAAAAVISKDITEWKQAEEALRESEEKYRTILNSIVEGYYEVDLKGNLTFVNPSMTIILGYSREELLGLNNRQFMDKENARTIFQVFNTVYRTGVPARSFDWELIRKDGTKAFVNCSISLKRDSSGNPEGFYGILHDITERKLMEDEIRALAIIDPLTGLYNRRGFITLAEQQMKNVERSKKGLFLVFADLDNLKKINDTLGHWAGDEKLVQLAGILKKTFRKADIIARTGGDEFAVLAEDNMLAEPDTIRKRLQRQIDLHNAKTEKDEDIISLSIGIVRYNPGEPETMDSLMSRADTRMYEHKKGKTPGLER